MKNLKVIPLTILALVLGLLMASKTFAAEDQKCYGAYGEEIPCPVINKSFNVQKAVIDGEYLIEEKRGVKANDEVAFDITVKNTGQLQVSNFVVVDNLPVNLEFVKLTTKVGKTVKATVENNSVKWTIEKFAPGESYSFVMITKANDNGIAEGSEKCETNIATILYKGTPEGSDTASVCIEKKKGEVLGEKTPEVLPDTADELPITVGYAIVSVILGALLFSASKLAEEKAK